MKEPYKLLTLLGGGLAIGLLISWVIKEHEENSYKVIKMNKPKPELCVFQKVQTKEFTNLQFTRHGQDIIYFPYISTEIYFHDSVKIYERHITVFVENMDSLKRREYLYAIYFLTTYGRGYSYKPFEYRFYPDSLSWYNEWQPWWDWAKFKRSQVDRREREADERHRIEEMNKYEHLRDNMTKGWERNPLNLLSKLLRIRVSIDLFIKSLIPL